MINKLRGLVFNFFYTLTVIGFGVPLLLITPLLNYPHRVKLFKLWPVSVQWLLKVICGIRVRVVGLENRPDRPVVIMSNHQSTWETLFLFSLLQPATVVLKRELTYIPLFGWLLRLAQPIVIDRSKKSTALKQILRQGKTKLQTGISVLVFPEGTRVPLQETRAHLPGGAILAVKSGHWVLPIVHNSGAHWPAHRLEKIPGEIVVRIGEPISVTGKSASTLSQEIENWMNVEKARLAGISKPN